MQWTEQPCARGLSMYSITVSDYLEKNATPQQREMGADLADWVVKEWMAEGLIED